MFGLWVSDKARLRIELDKKYNHINHLQSKVEELDMIIEQNHRALTRIRGERDMAQAIIKSRGLLDRV